MGYEESQGQIILVVFQASSISYFSLDYPSFKYSYIIWPLSPIILGIIGLIFMGWKENCEENLGVSCVVLWYIDYTILLLIPIDFAIVGIFILGTTFLISKSVFLSPKNGSIPSIIVFSRSKVMWRIHVIAAHLLWTCRKFDAMSDKPQTFAIEGNRLMLKISVKQDKLTPILSIAL